MELHNHRIIESLRLEKTSKIIKSIHHLNHLSFFPSGSVRATSNKSCKYLFILKCVSSTDEVNGINHTLRVKHILCCIRDTDLSNKLG